MRQEDWYEELRPFVSCRVLDALPAASQLGVAVAAVMQGYDTFTRSESSSTGSGYLFHSSELHGAVVRCVEQTRAIPEEQRARAVHLIAIIIYEHYAKSHSTKAALLSHALAGATLPQLPPDGSATQPEGIRGADTGGADGELQHLGRLPAPDATREIIRMFIRLEEKDPEFYDKDFQNLAKVVKQLQGSSASALPHVVGTVLTMHRSGMTERADGTGKKDLGGVLFKEATRYKSKPLHDLMAAKVLAEGSELPPLHAYQRDCVGMVLTSWGLPLHGGLRTGAQGQAAFAQLARGWRENWLISAPTGSGKTRVFVEVARGVLEGSGSRGAMVVVLVPNVLLTSQHAAEFRRARLPNTLISAHSSDSQQLTAQAWRGLVASTGTGASTVVVCTHASFLNLLRPQGGGPAVASLTDIDLLVLDEAHHCHDDHPYAEVMRVYQQSSASPGAASSGVGRRSGALGAVPRVLGVTASPAGDVDMAALDEKMKSLKALLRAELRVLPPDDPGVAEVVAAPTYVPRLVKQRPVEQGLTELIQGFALELADKLEDELARVAVEGADARRERDVVVQKLQKAIDRAGSPAGFEERAATRLDPIGEWIAYGRRFAGAYGCRNLELACRLLDVLRKSIELMDDVGYCGTVPYLARKAAALCAAEERGGQQPPAGGSAASAGPSCPAPTPIRGLMFGGLGLTATGAPSQSSGLVATPLGAALLGLMSPGPGLQGAAGAGASPLAGGAAAARGAAQGASSSGGSCADIQLRVSEAVRRLLEIIHETLEAAGSPGMLRDCFASGVLQEDRTFPKYWTLLQYLQKYRGRDTFHGIIFVRTRQVVFQLADLIRRTRQLDFVEVLELIGHASGSKRDTLAPEQDRHGRGMSDTQQVQVLQAFKTPGRKVLIATPAAEEGMDVPSCEFVVRYNAAATGIQLVQSRGRARMRVSEFVAILQAGTLDEHLHRKSGREEANMRTYGSLHAAAQGAAGSGAAWARGPL